MPENPSAFYCRRPVVLKVVSSSCSLTTVPISLGYGPCLLAWMAIVVHYHLDDPSLETTALDYTKHRKTVNGDLTSECMLYVREKVWKSLDAKLLIFHSNTWDLSVKSGRVKSSKAETYLTFSVLWVCTFACPPSYKSDCKESCVPPI